jgi:hypothetical protein
VKALMRTCLGVSAILIAAACAQGQESPQAATKEQATTSGDIRALSEAVLELKAQLKSMNVQMVEMQKEQQRSHEETLELRRQLAAAQKNMQSGAPGNYAAAEHSENAGKVAANTLNAAASKESPVDSANRDTPLEENQDLQEAKIADLYQTKVESGSKYRLRLSGIVLLNLYENRGNVNNQDFPEYATSLYEVGLKNSFGGSLRQSQLGLEAFGPDIEGAHTSASVKFDFAGGIPSTPYGTSTGIARLRTGTIRVDWTNTSVIAGQDFLFFAPLAPTSLASLAVPALSYNGNLWSWTPQVRVEHNFRIAESSSLIVEGGILDSLSGDLQDSEYYRGPTKGEASGQPAYATRVALRQQMFGQVWTLGFGGYYGRQNWGFGRKIDSWAGTTDLTMPLGKYFELTGEFYRGRALGGIGGGIGQSVLLTGSDDDPTTIIKGLDSMGGWAQLKFKPKPKWEFNGAFGQDNPFASELKLFSMAGNYGEPLARNRSAFFNVIYQLKSDLLLAAEYRRLHTVDSSGELYGANHINFSLGYIF